VSQQANVQPEERSGAETFVPRGAIAFMALLILVYAAIWLFFYALILNRP
jgi:hypothetical protein